MRKTKTFKIEGYDQTFEVKELRVKEVLDFFQVTTESTDIDSFKNQIIDKLLIKCSNIEFDDLLEMTPGEIEEIWKHFREVNNSFFVMARSTGLQKMFQEIQKAIIKDLSTMFVSLSKQDMEESSSTGLISSS